ncbi:paired amphipathic helix protein Sin3-like 4 [Cryptomeria japonica]|uniref:paired amphipathic helix protein Sin3-like 4 n=1 Tax=Cryptomeria japonica TaxID=3369 RepID=UPI0027DA376E|nr:paired amphipathic helix protein Sin3-like 4 [Cryptomeria japonica]
MLIKNLEAAIERVHELLEKQHAHFRIEDHLTAMNLRCIELIYGNCGLRIIDLLLEKPDRCLRVIVKRLQQKHDEWVDCRTRFNKGWEDVYTKYYQRSLDHHSSRFNQRDAKCLSHLENLMEDCCI